MCTGIFGCEKFEVSRCERQYYVPGICAGHVLHVDANQLGESITAIFRVKFCSVTKEELNCFEMLLNRHQKVRGYAITSYKSHVYSPGSGSLEVMNYLQQK
jgi:hypothetical protein